MYNRYVRNDAGVYERIPVQEKHVPPPGGPGPERPPHHTAPPPRPQSEPGAAASLSGLLGKNGFLSGILEKLKLKDIDTGDLLLLVILFLLFRDGEDDELLIALGLLLIL